MRKVHIKRRVIEYALNNKWQLLVVIFSLMAGTLIGSVFSVSMESESLDAMEKYINNFVSAYNLQPINNMEVFRFSVYNNIKTVLFLWISGLWIGFLPLAVFQVGLKGYKLGFSTALFVKSFKTKGIIFALISSIPQLLIVIPMVIIYAVFNINFSLFRYGKLGRGISYSAKNEFYIRNLLYLLAAVLIAVVAAWVDAYVMPPVLKPICSFWGK